MPAFPGFPNSYWVVEGQLAAGEYPGSRSGEEAAANVQHLIREGIDCFIDLTEERELEPYDWIFDGAPAGRGRRVLYLRRSIRDLSVPTRESMVEILNAIDEALAGGRRIYVHCWGGIGRTGTVVGCYLVRRGSSGAEALARVAVLFGTMKKGGSRQSPETTAQCAFVREWVESGSSGEAASTS